MALQQIPGGIWIPQISEGLNDNVISAGDGLTLDADEEEAQIIGRVYLKTGPGTSKTFGTSGSKIGWLPGVSITFVATATVRVGVKKASSIDAAAGPPARATIGAAAFDVYDDLVGGTDTITAITWREDTMSAGTPFTVTHGDLLAVCWHLDITANAQNVKVRCGNQGGIGLPAATLVTSGPTYGQVNSIPNFILTFDDGTLGWLEGTLPFSVADAASATIGNTNICANIIRVPFNCEIDAIVGAAHTGAGTNFAIALYSTPLGTPALVEEVTFDGNIYSATSVSKLAFAPFLTPHALTINTDYAISIRQTTATAMVTYQRDQHLATYMEPLGLGALCYAAKSTAGATFVAENSGKRRFMIWMRISALDDGVIPAPDYPSDNDVRDGVTYASGALEGDLVLPAAADVKTGTQYGTDGTEFTGTLVSGGGGNRRPSIFGGNSG